MFRRAAVLLLCMAFAVLCMLPCAAPAEPEVKTIRVGWYETPFNHKDSFGRRTGYAYEYQRKIAAYTGWKYEYVEGSWAELLQMLRDGRIDLMSDVSYTEERAEYMLYTNLPMGSERYYLYVSPDNPSITVDDPASLDGKKVGVTAGTVQKGLFLDWAQTRRIAAEMVELECSEEESLAMMNKGELDAFVTLENYGDAAVAVPLWKIGSSDFYFAVSKGRTDLLAELNTALNRIQDENKFYSEELAAKYLVDTSMNRYLTADEQAWLESHGPIRVGYQDGYLAFCASDAKGMLTGALKDYLAYAAEALENASPVFEAVAYPTSTDALKALRNGEVDCMFPANLSDYDGEVAGIVMTAPLMRTEMDAVIRSADKQDFLRKGSVRVAVNRGNPNYERFLLDNYPSWTPVYFENTAACLDAVAAKNADCVVISNYRYGDISRQCERLGLDTVYTGVDMDYCFAVREGCPDLYSILSRIISRVPGTTVNASLTYYSSEPPATTIWEYIADYPLIAALAALSIIFFAIIMILLSRLSASRKSGERRGRTGAGTS